MPSVRPALIIADLPFYDTPSSVEGSPYWVDLWAHVNGYRIGLQVKPKTYHASSLSIYTGKARSSQMKGHALFQRTFGGKVIIVTPTQGQVEHLVHAELVEEVSRLTAMTPGPYPPIGETLEVI